MWAESKGVFEIVVIMTVQNAFLIEIDQNEVFLFLKNYFWHQYIKKIWKYKKNYVKQKQF